MVRVSRLMVYRKEPPIYSILVILSVSRKISSLIDIPHSEILRLTLRMTELGAFRKSLLPIFVTSAQRSFDSAHSSYLINIKKSMSRLRSGWRLEELAKGSDNELGQGQAVSFVIGHKGKSNTSNQQLFTYPIAYPCPNFY